MKSNTSYLKFSGEYFFQYFALGALLPLLSVYFVSIGLSGTQIGTITAIGSFVTIFAPPIWGILSDRSQKHKTVIISLMGFCIGLFLIMPSILYFPIILIIFTLYSIASSGLNPLMDGVSLNHTTPFGQIRLWGSLGFAVASLVVGFVAKATSFSAIFYVYVIAMLITIAILSTIKIDLRGHEPLHINDVKALLTNKVFIIFMVYVFLIAGTLGAHNVYFGLLFKEVGGNTEFIGLAFMLFAASEAPFMKIIPYFIQRYGILKILLISPLLGMLRWSLHAIIPDPSIHLAIFFLQGLFYAPFLIGTAEYIRSRLSPNLRTTAMTMFTAIGFGLGGVLTNLVSGLLYDHISAKAIYVFYAILCAIAFFVMLLLYRLDHEREGNIL